MKFLVLILLFACKPKIPKELEPYKAQAEQEIEKAYQWEYKVIDPDLNNLNEQLNKLGQERWDCLVNEKIICKRKPKSVLNYVPRIF